MTQSNYAAYQARNDAAKGNAAANQQNRAYQSREAYDAAYWREKQKSNNDKNSK